jgi:hypothetical protein
MLFCIWEVKSLANMSDIIFQLLQMAIPPVCTRQIMAVMYSKV